MSNTRFTLLTIALLLALSAAAQPRSKAQQQRLAQQVLSQLPLQPAGTLAELKRTAHYAVYGYEQGGYAIVSESTLLPDVLGYADGRFSGETNPGLAWYLAQIDTLAVQAEQQGVAVRRAPLPDTSRFPASVGALLSSTWGQEAPYWNLCPVDPRYGTCYTGCVATAMAQVLYYHRFPPQGRGERSITYPLDSSNPVCTVTAQFGQTQYDWDHMRDSYAGSYSEQEAAAVATLMLHCGVAARMKYSVSGSGAYTADAAYGLREYFGIEAARAYKRADYVSSDWMDMVYTELSEHRPIVYGAADISQGFGHAFVLDGYNAQGQVHVNWGWDGDDNGYYDIDILNPNIYRFDSNQDMVVGIYGKPMELATATIEVAEPGQLAASIDDEAAIGYADLTVKGSINGSDLRRLRYMAGRDAQGHTTSGNLRRLDLSQARFVEGGEAYLTDGTQQYQTHTDELPPRAFYGCRALESLTLPSSLKRWGQAALALCTKLEEVNLTPSASAEFLLEDGVVYDRSRETVLAVLPSTSGRLKIPVGVTALDAYSLAGCVRLTSLFLPSTLQGLGESALYSCSGLTEIRCYSLSAPTVGTNALSSIDAEKCQLAVRRNMKEPFLQSMGWNIFTRNIREFYTLIKPRNASREYGDENPTFGYQLEGDDVEGEPLITSAADPTSPVGRYAITAEAGTIDDEALEFGEGTLIVRRAPLVVRPDDATRRPGEPNPDFTLHFVGLKNGETDPAFTTQPTITTSANEQSPEGQYPIVVSGGAAPNYSLSYEEGTLTVSASAPSAIEVLEAEAATRRDVVDLQGRRLGRQTDRLQRGLYIVGGKKILIHSHP